jgi:hypothetical protein
MQHCWIKVRFRVLDSRFRVQGSGFKVQGSRFRVLGSMFGFSAFFEQIITWR